MKNSLTDNSKLKSGALLLVMSSVLVKIISALFKIPLSSNLCLGDLGFGYFSSAHDLFMPIYFIAISGFPVAISNIISDNLARNKQCVISKIFSVSKKTITILSVICLLLFVVCVFPFVHFTDETGNSIYSFLAVAPSILFCFSAACYRGYFEGLNNMKPAAVSSVIEALGKLFLGLGFAIAVIKIYENPALAAAAAMIGISLGNFASVIYLKIFYKKNKIQCNYDEASDISNSKIAKKLLITCIPIVFASLSCSLVALIDGLTVRVQISGILTENSQGFRDVFAAVISEFEAGSNEILTDKALPTVLYGIRSKAFTLFNLIPTLTTSIGVGLMPFVTECYSKNDRKNLKEHVSAVFKLTSLICFPSGLGYVVFGERIMALLYGAGASSQFGGNLLQIYGFAVIFAGFSLPLSSILLAINKKKETFINVFCGIFVKILFNLLLCGTISVNVYGSAISTLMCFAVISVLNSIVLLKSVGKIPYIFKNVFKPLISSVICVFVAYLIGLIGDSSIITFVCIFAAVIVYFTLLIAFKILDESDVVGLPSGEKLAIFFKKLKVFR